MKLHLPLALILTLSLSACGESASAPDAATEGDAPAQEAPTLVEATPDAAALPTADAMAPATEGEVAPVILTLDRTQMADADCHVMGEVVMGQCDEEAALQKALGAAELIPVNTTEMTDAACHYMLGAVMGTCTAEEIAAIRASHTIVVDTETMAEEPCHTMGNTIMGTCTAEEIQDQAQALATSW